MTRRPFPKLIAQSIYDVSEDKFEKHFCFDY